MGGRLGKVSAKYLLRAVAWLCLGIAGHVTVNGLHAGDDLGWVLLVLPPVFIALVCRVELQRLEPGAGLMPVEPAEPEHRPGRVFAHPGQDLAPL